MKYPFTAETMSIVLNLVASAGKDREKWELFHNLRMNVNYSSQMENSMKFAQTIRNTVIIGHRILLFGYIEKRVISLRDICTQKLL